MCKGGVSVYFLVSVPFPWKLSCDLSCDTWGPQTDGGEVVTLEQVSGWILLRSSPLAGYSAEVKTEPDCDKERLIKGTVRLIRGNRDSFGRIRYWAFFFFFLKNVRGKYCNISYENSSNPHHMQQYWNWNVFALLHPLPPTCLTPPANLTLELLGWRTSDCVTSTWSPTAGTTIRATCALTGRSFTLLVWHLCRPAEPSGCVPHTCERKQPGLGSDSHKTAYLPTHTDAQARRLRTHKHNDKNNTNGAVSTSKYLTIKEKWGHRIKLHTQSFHSPPQMDPESSCT